MATSSKKKKKTTAQLVKGTLQLTRSGLGFVSTAGEDQDILIRREHTGSALDGDEVAVEITHAGGRKGAAHRRTEGVVRKVLRRKQEDFTGVLEVKEHFAFLTTDSPMMPVDVFIPINKLNGAVNGDRALVHVTDWNEDRKNPAGEVLRVLTHESANEVAMQSILSEQGFSLTFPDEALEAAARLPDSLDADEIRSRKDFRNVLTLTIDPRDARDFDDALSFRRLKNGNLEIGVHIADVAFYVTEDTALDKEAENRATSVYLPDRVLPMLPEHISNFLCSLRPDEDKYAFSAVFEITPKGKVKDYWLGRTVIHSNRRFTYEEAQAIIEGGTDPLQEEVLELNAIARQLRRQRFEKGAINFATKEVRFVLDENAKPIGIEVKESKEANQLIEEFMLLANRTVAAHVAKVEVKGKPLPFPYRVHDRPDEEKLAQFAQFALKFGYRLPVEDLAALPAAFNAMLHDVQGKPEQQVLESLGIRVMSKAIYTTENIGHFGLGFEDYCHFTSPIRRYPDVLAHRILATVLEGHPKVYKKLEATCRHCSQQERAAMDAERSANKYKQVEYMLDFLGEEFDAIVTGVSSFGFWATTVSTHCEGLVSLASLSGIDDFVHHENDYTLMGRHTGLSFRTGDAVKIRVVAGSLDKRQLDYELAAVQPRRNGTISSDQRSNKKPRKTDKSNKGGRKGR